MSRCFPYPPPPQYYEEGLIELIKKESEKARKERRKEKKREKKEKRDRDGQEHEKFKRSKYSHKKIKYTERSQLNQKDGYDAKAKATAGAVEQLERSGLTEEHEQPCSIQNIYDSSESSQDSGKRRKLMVATNGNKNSHGSILRIRLPLIKQIDAIPPTSMPIVKKKDPAPPASTRMLKQNDPLPPASAPKLKQKDLKLPATMPQLKQTHLELSRTSEEPCFSGRVPEAAIEMEAAKSPSGKSSSKRRRIHEMEKQFTELAVNWNPPPLQLELSDIGNQDWLFGSSKHHSGLNSNMLRENMKGLLSHGSSVSSSMQPQACYLPDFDIYQLPYVIPY